VKKVIFEAEENEHRLTFDAAKLAKSFEENMNVYFNYTLSYQKRMNSKQKSGLGHIKILRTALTDFFMSSGVELSKIALAKLGKWQKSRKRDDMTAKMKDIDPVKFSNARSSLPYGIRKDCSYVGQRRRSISLGDVCMAVEYDRTSV